MSNPLDINYDTHERVQRLIDIIRFCIEDISLSFERWDDPYTTGPGLYFAIISGTPYETTLTQWGIIGGQ